MKNKERTKDNITMAIQLSPDKTKWQWVRLESGLSQMRDAELEFYEFRYGNTLEKRNASYKEKGKQNAMKSMEQYYNVHPPVETILQIGKSGQTVDEQTATECIQEWISLEINKYPNMHFLSFSIHFDEETPHAHIRYTLDVDTEKGSDIREKQACEAMGYSQKNPFNKEKFMEEHSEIDFSSKLGKKKLKDASNLHEKYDNAKMYFTDACRNDWYNILLN